ncbi:hypothetical protein AF71_00056930 [Rhizobium sp. 57MFTsu3.2]|nr:hypothetical protein [Rhizobium sp. 57MFTsu3.2]
MRYSICSQRLWASASRECSASFPQASQTCPNPHRPQWRSSPSEDAVYVGRLDAGSRQAGEAPRQGQGNIKPDGNPPDLLSPLGRLYVAFQFRSFPVESPARVAGQKVVATEAFPPFSTLVCVKDTAEVTVGDERSFVRETSLPIFRRANVGIGLNRRYVNVFRFPDGPFAIDAPRWKHRKRNRISPAG